MPNKRYTDCIEACNHCANECTWCANECLHERDVKMMARCIELDRDCSTLCRAGSLPMSGHSDFALEICRVCAQACRACAEECGNIAWSIAACARKPASVAPRNATR